MVDARLNETRREPEEKAEETNLIFDIGRAASAEQDPR